MTRDFRLAPPAAVSVELFDRGRDVNGNPTAHYLLIWSNEKTGAEYESGRYRTKRRVQVGYCDKATPGALGLCRDLFPGTEWKLQADSWCDHGLSGVTFTLERDHDREDSPVIFRADKDTGDVFAVFPVEAWTRDPYSLTVYSRIGQHSGASLDYFRTMTKPAPEGPELDALRAELRGMGYRLDERKRMTDAMNETRAARCAV